MKNERNGSERGGGGGFYQMRSCLPYLHQYHMAKQVIVSVCHTFPYFRYEADVIVTQTLFKNSLDIIWFYLF